MTKIAVDVVLLPCEEVTDKAIELNRELNAKFSNEIVLNKSNCLPHISLAMGCINKSDLPVIENILASIAKKNPIGKFRIKGISISENARGEKVSSFEIEKTEKLQMLHEEVIKEMERFFGGDVTGKMLYGSEKIAESTLEWIKNYRKKSSFENFWPHITLGYGIIEGLGFSKEMDVVGLAVCHLGNHCTCRKILAELKI